MKQYPALRSAIANAQEQQILLLNYLKRREYVISLNRALLVL